MRSSLKVSSTQITIDSPMDHDRLYEYTSKVPIPLAPLTRRNQNSPHSPPLQGGFRGIGLLIPTQRLLKHPLSIGSLAIGIHGLYYFFVGNAIRLNLFGGAADSFSILGLGEG